MADGKYLEFSTRLLSKREWEEYSKGHLITSALIFNPDGSYNKDGLFSPAIWPKENTCSCGNLHGKDVEGLICEKCGQEPLLIKDNNQRQGFIKLSSPILGLYKREVQLLLKYFSHLETEKNDISEYLNGRRFIALLPAEENGEKTFVEKDLSIKDGDMVLSLYPGCTCLSGGDLIDYKLSQLDVFETQLLVDVLIKNIENTSNKDSVDEKQAEEREKELDDLYYLKGFIEDFIQLTDDFGNPFAFTDLMQSYISVPAPDFRPMTRKGQSVSYGDFNELYLNVLNINNSLESEHINQMNFKKVVADKALLNIKASEVISKNVERINKKYGVFVSLLEKQPVDGSCTAVVGSGYDLKMDEMGVSYAVAFCCFEPFIVSQMKKNNPQLTVSDCKKQINMKTEEAKKALEEIIEDRIIMVSRSPELHEGGFFFNKAVLMPDTEKQTLHNIEISPLQCEAMNCDHDGDTCRVQGIWSYEEEQKARAFMQSYPNIFSSSSGRVLAYPRQDAELGIYYATRDPSSFCYGFDVIVDRVENINNHPCLKSYIASEVIKTEPIDRNRIFFEKEDVTERLQKKGLFIAKGNSLSFFQSGKNLTTKKVPRDSVAFFTDNMLVVRSYAEKTMDLPTNANTEALKKGTILYANKAVIEIPNPRRFQTTEDVKKEFESGEILINERIMFSLKGGMVETTPGRVLFNDLFLNHQMTKEDFINCSINTKTIKTLIDDKGWALKDDRKLLAKIIEDINKFGFQIAKYSGISTKLSDFENEIDFSVIEDKRKELDKFSTIQAIFELQDQETDKAVLQKIKADSSQARVVFDDNDDIKDFIEKASKTFIEEVKKDPESNINIIIESGARGGWDDVAQAGSVIGFVTDKSGKSFKKPILSNYVDGLKSSDMYSSVVEAIAKSDKSSAGGVAKTGSLANYIKDALKHTEITVKDCHSDSYEVLSPGPDSLYRFLALDLKDKDGTILFHKGEAVNPVVIKTCHEKGIEKLSVRTPLGCHCHEGLCAKCYGLSAKTRKEVDLHLSVGMMAACNFGEQSTQNLLNVNKGKSIISSLEMVESIFENKCASNMTYIKTPAEYKQKLQQIAASFTDIFKGLNLNVPLRDTQLLTKAMYERVRIEEPGKTGLQKGMVYNISEVFDSIKPEFEDKDFPLFVCRPCSIKKIGYDKLMFNPGNKAFLNAYQAVLSANKLEMPQILARTSISSKAKYRKEE